MIFEIDGDFQEILASRPAQAPDSVEIPQRLQRYLEDDLSRSFDLFSRNIDKDQLYQITQQTTDFIRSNEVKAVVLVDTSARLFSTALKTYWDLLGVTRDEAPDIFFVDPDGFAYRRDDSVEDMRGALEADHPFLAKHRENPILVFDTCAHTGKTLSSILGGLEKSGFNNVLVGTASNDRDRSGIAMDINVIDGFPAGGCYPFERDNLVTHSVGGVLIADAVGSMNEFYGSEPRGEIKEIITQFYVYDRQHQLTRSLGQSTVGPTDPEAKVYA